MFNDEGIVSVGDLLESLQEVRTRRSAQVARLHPLNKAHPVTPSLPSASPVRTSRDRDYPVYPEPAPFFAVICDEQKKFMIGIGRDN